MDLTSYLLGKKSSGGGSGGIDWSKIGLTETPYVATHGYDIAKNIYDNWDSSITSLSGKWYDDWNLPIMPLVDTSNVTNWNNAFRNSPIREIPALNTSSGTNFSNCFNGCVYLSVIPVLDLSKATTLSNMFTGCYHLSKTTLDNILASLAGATKYTGTKTLSYLGFTSTYQKVATLQACEHYQAFVSAGWSIGY